MYDDGDFGYDAFERDDDYNVWEERQLDLDREAEDGEAREEHWHGDCDACGAEDGAECDKDCPSRAFEGYPEADREDSHLDAMMEDRLSGFSGYEPDFGEY